MPITGTETAAATARDLLQRDRPHRRPGEAAVPGRQSRAAG